MASASKATSQPPELEAAYGACAAMARSHYENFTVVSWFMPQGLRPFFYAIYAFCRHTDDLGDEAAGDRLALLDAWEHELLRCYTGDVPRHPILLALQDTIRRFDIPERPFRRLIEANRMDQRRTRYPTYAELLHYCSHSAEPVGHMVLYLLGYRDAERQRLSDATCTGLQLANFWQDVARDYQKGRIYLPLEDMARFGYSETDLAAGIANKQFRDLLRFEVNRAEALLREGMALTGMVNGIARLDLALFGKGGLAVLDAIRRQEYDVLTQRPTVSTGRKLRMMASTAASLMILRRP